MILNKRFININENIKLKKMVIDELEEDDFEEDEEIDLGDDEDI